MSIVQAAGPSTSTAAPRPPGTSTPPSRGGSSGSPGTPGSAPGSSPSVLTTSESINKPLLDNVQHLESKNFKNFQNKTLSTSQTIHATPSSGSEVQFLVSSCLKSEQLNRKTGKSGIHLKYPFNTMNGKMAIYSKLHKLRETSLTDQ